MKMLYMNSQGKINIRGLILNPANPTTYICSPHITEPHFIVALMDYQKRHSFVLVDMVSYAPITSNAEAVNMHYVATSGNYELFDFETYLPHYIQNSNSYALDIKVLGLELFDNLQGVLESTNALVSTLVGFVAEANTKLDIIALNTA